MIAAGWQPQDFASAATKVEFENTNFLGSGKTYARFMVPGGGLMYAGYDLNHSYHDTDVFVSLAKLKEHRTAGVTLSMKNCFGITPCTIYSDQAPVGRAEHCSGRLPRPHALRLPRAAQERAAAGGKTNSKDPGYRVPRITADLVAVAAHSPGRHRRHLHHDRRRTAQPAAQGWIHQARSSRPADRGHELRLHRRRGHGRDGLRSHGRPRHAAL